MLLKHYFLHLEFNAIFDVERKTAKQEGKQV